MSAIDGLAARIGVQFESRERMVPGGARGLQNRWRVSFDARGGSTPLAPAESTL